MLDVIANIHDRVVPGPALGSNLLSWLVRSRVDQRSASVERVCGQIASEHPDQFRAAVSDLLQLKSAEAVLQQRFVNGLLLALADPAFQVEQRTRLAGLLLRLPWVCLRYSPGRTLLQLFKDEGLARASIGRGAKRGYALEAAVAADQLLDSSAPKHRFVFTGATRIGKDGVSAQEWDVLRLDLDRAQGWNLTAIECAVTRTGAKDEESRAKLEYLRTQLAARFGDLTTYRTLLATVKKGELHYQDAGRSWTDVVG
jgi:hypothetical protein